MSYCPTCGVVSPPESHWQGCQTAPKVTDAADFDEGYRQGRRDTRAELVPVIDRQRAELDACKARITELEHALTDLLAHLDAHPPVSFGDMHDHDCFELWCIERDHARIVLAASPDTPETRP